ncbi:MAG TPA: DUF3299 domain-containing protein [Chthonomonadaceae bacterium]|nr:DUF3299 domain-containing protein [Chthonomonadaceae bacterium]
MLYVRNPALFKSMLFVLGVVCLINHGDSLLRRRIEAGQSADTLNINVQSEGSLLGHNSIGIDENSLSAPGAERFLHFSTLGQWDFEKEKPTACPKPIQDLTGQKFSSVGFMYPLEAGEKVKTFCLLRSTQTCCYGPRPQYNQYMLIEMKTPVAFERMTPILVNGTFFVEPKPEDGYIYRMEADAVRPVDSDAPDIDPVSAAKQAKLPLFDYAPLTGMGAKRDQKAIPEALQALSGKTVVLGGYCVRRTRHTPPHIRVSKAWWDGVAQGEPPTIYNSVVVLPEDGKQVPPLWKPFQVFTGVLHVTSDPSQWSHEGIVQLLHARLGVPGVTPARGVMHGPLLPWEVETLLLALLLVGFLRWRRRAEDPA